MEYNKEHGITPKTIIKKISSITDELESEREKAAESLAKIDRADKTVSLASLIRSKEKQMTEAVKELDFETAAILRDEIKVLKRKKK
jgi:excinuclease ABC subunit B